MRECFNYSCSNKLTKRRKRYCCKECRLQSSEKFMYYKTPQFTINNDKRTALLAANSSTEALKEIASIMNGCKYVRREGEL